MKKYLVLTFLVAFGSTLLYSQSDTLNQFDSNGKKNGWWITYLDSNLEILTDSIGATHCMYNYYLDDIFLHRYGNGLGSKKYPIHFPANEDLKIGHYKLLNGDYITNYKNGNIQSVLSTSEGFLIYYKHYYPDGQLKYEFIYSEECGAPIRHCIREYSKDGEMKYDGFNWVPKKALETAVETIQYTDSSEVSVGRLDGNSYQIEVKQVGGKKHSPESGWPIDKLIFNAGKMYSVYMQERESFYPSKYSTSSNNIDLDSIISFNYENNNSGGSLLQIAGTVQGKTIKGAITWTSGSQESIIRTYTFEGVLI